MRKALVFYLYSNRNAGDMAICVGAIELLKQQEYEITMVSRFGEGEEEYLSSKAYIAEYFPDVIVYPGPFHFDREESAAKQLCGYASGLLKSLLPWPDKQISQLIEACDVVFFNGGNLLRATGFADYARLMALFYPIKWAKEKGKSVYCLPQSTARLDKLGKILLGKNLTNFDRILIREDISLQELRRMYPSIRFESATDMAFACKDHVLAQQKADNRYALKSEKKTIALVLRNTGIGDIGTLPKDVEMVMMKPLYEWVVRNTDYRYLLIVQTKKDRDVSYRFLSAVSPKAEISILEEYDPLVVREVYKRVDMTISMRLHAAILSLSALTPVIGVFSRQWGLKNPGIMSQYNMPYVIMEDQQGASIDEMLAKAQEKSPEDIKKKISENLQRFCNNI